MFSRRKRNYRVFVVTALIIAICVLIAVILWPDTPEPKPEPNMDEINVDAHTDVPKEENTNNNNKTYYIVKKSGDVISVFFVTKDGSEIKLEDTEILYELLPPEDQAKFDSGIILDDQERLSSLLQDFEG